MSSMNEPQRHLVREKLHKFGLWMQAHRRQIQLIQWCVVLIYFSLLIIPAFLDLPPQGATILSNLVMFAQFVFWGIWWPFVILSMIICGRLAWCGIFCPEGALAEWSSRRGMNKTIPRWMKWRGWPTAAFIMTTLYGQLISVYDYADAALLILGGSTLAAMTVGFFFGRGTRVWCRYLCPVNGVFNLLSRLAPISFKTDQQAWRAYKGPKNNPQCPPMINIHRLHGVSACHMCGRCAGFRNAVNLEPRSPNEEVSSYGAEKNNPWELRLLLYGIIGVAIGAFTWTVNPHFVAAYQSLASWLVEHDILFPLNANAPWFILTHHPENNDSFNWVYGACIAFYILASGLLYGWLCSLLLSMIGGISRQGQVLKLHLGQALIPIGAAGLFLGLSATTVKLLGYSGIEISYLTTIRFIILFGSSLWSFYLACKILQQYKMKLNRFMASLALFTLCLIPILEAWYAMFWLW